MPENSSQNINSQKQPLSARPGRQLDTRLKENEGALICLVEDDEALAEELIRVFGHFGYRVDRHARLPEAASAIRRHKPDVLIMDVVFHDNGLNTIEHVALHPAFHELDRPIIFLSDQDDFSARVQAARIGAEGFFLKPLDIPKLIDRLEQSLRRQQVPPPIACWSWTTTRLRRVGLHRCCAKRAWRSRRSPIRSVFWRPWCSFTLN
ncbi:MAG TPA: response regulator [Desulfonatronum sp.]|nr:response regulator [Desulfonatronum sp.]